MKSIKYIIGLLFVALLAVSCGDDFLEETAPDKLNTSVYWRDYNDADAGMAAVYSHLEMFTGWDAFVEGRSVIEYYRSDMTVPGADASNYPWWTEHYHFSFDKGNYAILLLWDNNYRGINYANQVIDKLPGIPEDKITAEQREQLMAEARFMRGYYHFKLLINFNQIIVRDKYPESQSDLFLPLVERAVAWDFIIEDFKAAQALKPLKSQDKAKLGRATQGAAFAYLGKAYLYRSAEDATNKSMYLTEAQKAFNTVISGGDYDIEADFEGLFDGTNENSSECIFALQMSPVVEGGASYSNWQNYFIGPAELDFYGEVYGSAELLTEMKKEGNIGSIGQFDDRMYGTIYFNDPYYNDNAYVLGSTYDDVFGAGSTTVAFKKHYPNDPSSAWSRCHVDQPLMRYADVLLMQAEILNQSNPADAISLINELRTKRGLPEYAGATTETAVFEQIKHERIMEFTLEGSRFFDLRRWGMADEIFGDRVGYNSNQLYYPVPEDEENANPNLYGN
ncbi:RagB/SusD family nutrient uptake outer membrane protein [Carboxylicivirga sp. A043]|uniref:RagB/SusD family nutrient uptake outer membrane protein n=1 Tax=Carboxylicivirga litoralis TaxID=2816963 RepID=UPI0021CAF697|nr:RagB/SusD family nutrient uptake outer membrane protein [Carboxylicivirga sp. A043]MCU4157485.1 RagB/SusD family nutrient uptake outer membrane protein [Carboxylicivirga sp. A043]